MFQLFTTLRAGYQLNMFGNRWFIEPSVAATAWPINTNVPADFAALDRKWNGYFLFEPAYTSGDGSEMTPNLRTLLLLTLCVSPATAHAQEFAPDARIDSVFADYNRPDVPGCALGVYRDGRIVYARGYGLADLERRVPISQETVFDIGSTSKQFTAATIVLLAQEGELSLDDDVRRFIPELPVYERPITVRHLLHHTSGMRDYIGLLRLAGVRYDDVTTPDDALQMIARQRALNFAPGDEHLYSNSGYFLLSLIVERATGRSLRVEANDRIFAPLGMTRTRYQDSYDDIIADRALGYEPRDSGYRADMPRWLQLGDGAVFTTVRDLLHWHENFYNNRIGGNALRDTMLTRGQLTSGKVLDYALGLIHGEHRGLVTIEHGGSWGGYRSEFLRFPAQRYGLAVLCNRGDVDPSSLAMRVAEIHLAKEMNALPVASAKASPSAAANVSSQASPVASSAKQLRPLAAYAGTYRVPGTGDFVTLAVVDGALRLLEPGRYAVKERTAEELEVVGTPVILRFAFDSSANTHAVAAQVTIIVGGEPENTYQRVPVVVLSPETAAARAGSYSSAELGTTLVIAQRDTVLELKLRNATPTVLRAVGVDEMFGAGLSLEFTRNARGAVTGLLMNQGRARGLRFERQTQPR